MVTCRTSVLVKQSSYHNDFIRKKLSVKLLIKKRQILERNALVIFFLPIHLQQVITTLISHKNAFWWEMCGALVSFSICLLGK